MIKKIFTIFGMQLFFFSSILVSTFSNAQKIKIQYFDTDRAGAIQYFQQNGASEKKKHLTTPPCQSLQCHLVVYQEDPENGSGRKFSQAQSPISGKNGVYEVFQKEFPQYITRIDYVLTSADGSKKSGSIDLRDRTKFYDTEEAGFADWNAAGADTICIFADGSVMHRIYVS